MKKTIAIIVGALLMFIWQTLSWTVLDLHRPAQDYTPKQDSILAFLNSNLNAEGGYLLPNTPKGTSFEDANKAGEKSIGKPWASIQYHKSFAIDSKTMMLNMARGFVANLLIIGLFVWLISQFAKPTFVSIFLASLAIGFAVFLNTAYTNFIWYKIFDLYAYLTDALVGWGVAGVWLGFYLKKKK